jgi:biopolymer transport protein TolR
MARALVSCAALSVSNHQEALMRATASRSLQSDINVTPLVDVCLVLLIIFMVVLPTVVNGVPVALPEASVKSSFEERALPVTVKDDGTVYVDTLVIRREELPGVLKGLRATAAGRPMAVRADKRVLYGDVAGVLGACRDAGWTDVALVTTPRASAVAATQP